MPRPLHPLTLFLALPWAVGCGASYPETTAVQTFPTTAQLEAVEVPVAPAEWILPRVPTETLTLSEAPALGEGTSAADDRSLVPLLDGNARLRPTAGMHCAASALARFYLRERALPDDAALAFVLGRCGVASLGPAIGVRVWDRDEEIEDEADAERADADTGSDQDADQEADEARETDAPTTPPEGLGFDGVAEELGPALERFAPFAVEVGSASATSDSVTVYLGLASPHRVATSVTRLEDGRFLISGRLETERMRDISAWVNQGDYGVAACEREPGADLPDFRFTCEMNRHDVSARVDLIGVPRQRLTSRRLASLLLFADADASLTYRPQPPLPSESDADAELVLRLAALLAAAREEAGRDPLSLASAESTRQAPFLGKLIEARASAEASLEEELALGFLAGWSVDGTVARGELQILESTSEDPPAAFAQWLATPDARRVLLSAGPRSVAITARQMSDLTATFTLFRVFDETNVDALRASFRARLDEARRQSGVRPFTYLDDVADLQQEAERVTREGVHPREALDDAMARLRGRLGRTVRCYEQTSYDPRWAELPVEFQESGNVSAVTGIAFQRPAGAAWGQLVLFLCVFPD